MGHLYEYYRASKMHSDSYRAFQAASREEISTDILHRAAEKMGVSSTDTRAMRDLIGSVSRYAQSDNSEALAECVADVYANGRNATQFSREVWRIMTAEGR